MDEKKDYIDMSRTDRERYESEKNEMKMKKEHDDTNENQHCILETVKNRSKIISKLRE